MLIVILNSKRSLTFLLAAGCILSCLWMEGCSEQRTAPYDRQTVTTFAELSLLYEKEKMAHKVTDSSYQIRVDSFFISKGTTKEAFKKKIDQISSDNIAWRGFIQKTSRVIDSLKTIGD